MKTYLFRVLFVSLLFTQSDLALAKEIQNNVMRLYSYVQRPDYDSPWSTKQSERLTHLAMVVGPRELLVSAYAARSAKHFEAEKIGEARRYPLKVKAIDSVVNLALLEFTDAVPDGLETISFGDDLELGANVTIYQAADGESLVARTLRLREVAMQPGVLTSYQLPQYVLEIRKSGYGWFEPLIRNGKLTGAAVSQSGSSVYALPVSLLKRFVRDAQDGTFAELPELGISFTSLLSPALRKYAKAESTEDGVWIQDIKETSAFANQLKRGDILLSVNGTPVSARGSFEHPLWGRISIVAKLSELSAGETAELKILREGEPLTLKAELTPYDPTLERISSEIDAPAPYLIFGGLVIQELTEGLLQSWGSAWRKRAPTPYLLEDTFHAWPENGGKNKLLVLQRVLPLEANKGYHDFEDYFVTAVNGKSVHSMEDLIAALDQPEAGREAYARLQLEPGHDEIILSYKGLGDLHAQLRKRYGIPASASFWQGKSMAHR